MGAAGSSKENPYAKLSNREKKVIRRRVAVVHSVLSVSAGRTRLVGDTSNRHGHTKFFESRRARTDEATIFEHPGSTVEYRAEREGRQLLYPRRTDDIEAASFDVEILEDRLTIELLRDSGETEELAFDFLGLTLREVARLAGSAAVRHEQAKTGLFSRMGVACTMLEQAAGALASLPSTAVEVSAT